MQSRAHETGPVAVSPVETAEGLLPPAAALARQRALERLFQARVSARQSGPEGSLADRRSFLGVGVTAAFGAVAWGSLGRSVRAHADGGAALETMGAAATVGSFAWETVLFQCGQYALGQLVRHFGLPLGNASLTKGEITKDMVVRTIESFERDPYLAQRLYTTVGWLGPATEEALFRIAPGILIGRDGMKPGVGLATTLVFAGVHNVVPSGHSCRKELHLSESVKLSLDRIPLPQFLLGAYCWYVMRRYGEVAPIIAHALNNQGAAFAVVWGGKDTYREYQQILHEELQSDATD